MLDPGRGRAVGRRLMGHLDTSYSGREPWLDSSFQPQGFEREGRIYGLGISNMKGAPVAYLAAVRALGDTALRGTCCSRPSRARSRTQQGDAQGAEYRGYAAGSRYLVGHGGAADMCILGEPTEQKLVLAHFGALWLRLTTSEPFIHRLLLRAPEGELDRAHARRARPRARTTPEWGEGDVVRGACAGSRGTSARDKGGFGWRASQTPRTDLFLDLRVPPDVEMAAARRKALEIRARGLGA